MTQLPYPRSCWSRDQNSCVERTTASPSPPTLQLLCSPWRAGSWEEQQEHDGEPGTHIELIPTAGGVLEVSSLRQSAPEPRGGGGTSADRGKVAADVGGWGRELTFPEDDSRNAGRWPEEASASSGARQVAFTASGRRERFTINLPRTAGSALREARAAAASTATGVEVGEARVAAVASMGRQGRAPG
jgi:hypothetical protein